MDFDMNQDFGGDIKISDIVAVDHGVENRHIHEWNLNMDVSFFVDDGDVERVGEVDGTHLVNALAIGDEFDSVDNAVPILTTLWETN